MSDQVIKNLKRQDGAVVLELSGEIDMQSSSQLRDKFREIFQDKPKVIVVNMQGVNFMDSSGLATLVEALKWSRKNDSQLKLTNLVKAVRNIFEISKLESIFEIFDTESEALA